MLLTDARYVASIGVVEIDATILPDSTGALVEISGIYRRLTRLAVIFSAVSAKRERMTYGAGGLRERDAWNALADIARDLGGDSVTYGMPPL